jgi:quercetin dioxygenase-like cupin family protein
MEITRSGAQPSAKGPSDWFTGAVRVDPLFSPADPARVAGALVTFEPGARTAWHTHPLGQTLLVTAGRGWAQRDGGPIEEIRPRRETLARCLPHRRDEPHRHPGKARRQDR